MGILRVDKISGLETPTPVTGSVVFDGTGDNLTLAASTDFAWGTGDFTWEAWVYSTASDHTSGNHYMFDLGGGNLGAMSYYQDRFNYYNSTVGSNGQLGSFPANKWTHIAVSRNNSISSIFIDGILQGSISDTHNYGTSALAVEIAGYAGGSNLGWQGYISNLRVCKGHAVYTGDFTPPVHELEVIGDTVLLCCNNPDSAGADGTGKTITVNGDAAASTFSPGLTRDFTGGTEFRGVTTFDTQGYFVPPSGTTEQRGRGRGLIAGGVNVPSAPTTSLNSIEYITISSMGNAQGFGDLINSITSVGSLASSTRGIFAGGLTSPSPVTYTNEIQYVTTASTGNAVDFGNLTADRRYMATCSSNTRGVFMGGEEEASPNAPTDDIKFITIATLGDAEEFGDLTNATENAAGCSSPTRGIIGGGDNPADTNTIEFITIASTGDATNFGDLTDDRTSLCAGSSSTRGIFAGGRNAPTNYNIIDYITIATTGNAQDFGDLIGTINQTFNIMSNSIRGVRSGGNPNGGITINSMEYVTIASTGNSQDFGDLIQARREHATCADSHGGIS